MSDFALAGLGSRYVPVAQIGAGCAGRWFKAEDALYGGFVAVKVLLRDWVDDYEDWRPLLMNQARLQVRLSHPDGHSNVVRFIDLRALDDGIGVVMELVDGPSLHKRMGPRNKPNEISLAEFSDFMSQTCCGLQFAHDRMVIHRDIKPANLMINSDGKVKIVGWELVENFHADGPIVSFAGTIPYMPPEVVHLEWMSREERMHSGGVDQRADLYSLGATMYHVLTLELPFDADCTRGLLIEIEGGVRDRHWRKLEERHIETRLAQIVLKVMAKGPDDRHQSADELQRALQAFQVDCGRR